MLNCIWQTNPITLLVIGELIQKSMQFKIAETNQVPLASASIMQDEQTKGNDIVELIPT